jgi:hypothetical protein
MDEALKTFASTQKPVNPEYWNSFKNQKFGFMLSILHTMYIENKLTDEELIDQIKILINQQKYDFNNLSTDMGEFEKTSKEILEGLKNHGIICNQAAILELYVYTKITGQAGGMIAGIAKTDQSGKFNSTMLHAVPIMRTHEGKYIINDPTPTSGPGGEKLAKLVQKMNEDEKNKKQQIWNYLEGFILVGSVGLGIFVLVPKVGEIQQKRADLKMQNLNENVEFVTKNQESLTLLWRLLQPVKYGNEEIDQKYLQKHSETILSNKINYSFDELKSYFSQLQEILTLKLNPKHKLSSEAVQLKTQLKRLYLELKKHPSENQDLIELKTVLESLLK